jgi:hypothetical protein
MLNFNASWHRPVELIDGTDLNLVYSVKSFESFPDGPGAYVFARVFGKKLVPLYIGEAVSVRTRIRQHLEKHVKLVNGVKKSGTGKKVVMFCTVKTSSEQRRGSMLKILQRALIEHALSEGHELLNVQLTKLAVHSIKFTGNRLSEQLAPRKIFVRGT